MKQFRHKWLSACNCLTCINQQINKSYQTILVKEEAQQPHHQMASLQQFRASSGLRPTAPQPRARIALAPRAAAAVATMPSAPAVLEQQDASHRWAVIRVAGATHFLEVGRALAVKSSQLQATVGGAVRFTEVLACKSAGSFLKGPRCKNVIVEGIVQDQFLAPTVSTADSTSNQEPLSLSKVVITSIETTATCPSLMMEPQRLSKEGKDMLKPRLSNSIAPAPRGSHAGTGQQPRLSTQGSLRRGPRHSTRNSYRSGQGHATGDGGQQMLQVIDDDGVDRTPRPLLSVRPSVLKSAGPGHGGVNDDLGSPSSEAASEFFLDRMSSAFGRGGPGWASGSESGVMTPKSDQGAEEDYEMQREKAKAAAAAAAAEEQAEVAEQTRAEQEEQLQQHMSYAPTPQLLTERDLEQNVTIMLSETATDFLLIAPSVTVSLESDEAAAVEADNKKYMDLLASKAGSDKYSEQEAQTLNPVTKGREVQSCVMTTNSTGCQATNWDIVDAQSLSNSQAAAAAAAAAQDNGTMLSVSQLAGSVAHGNAYGRGHGHQSSGTGGGSFMQNGGIQRMSSMVGGGSVARASTFSWGAPTVASVVPGMIPSTAGSRGGVSVSGSVADGPAMADGGHINAADLTAAAAVADPLLSLRDLMPALTIMDMALCQNSYLPKLLQYRDITPIAQRPDTVAALPRAAHTDGARSNAASRPVSRLPSETGSAMYSAVATSQAAPSQQSLQRAMSGIHADKVPSTEASRVLPNQASMSQMGERSQQGDRMLPPGYAPSMAESAWPEELLQDLADLGPDGVPRMDHLWDWQCPLTDGQQVVCMAWNKKTPDLLAVGYGTQSFSKAAAAAGMGSGCYGSAAPAAAVTSGTQSTNAAGAPLSPMRASQQQQNAPLPSASTPNGESTQQQGTMAAAGPVVHGIVAFWSLKHPEYPLWWFKTKSGVTALDFSTHQPNILAVGLYNGTVSVYDVKSHQGTPAMESDSHTGRHSDPVWKVKWIDRGHERDEFLVSISTDGRVTQWSIAKGLEFSDLMSLKRVPRKATSNNAAPGALPSSTTANGSNGKVKTSVATSSNSSGEGDAFISRLTSGMSFDFSAKDQRMYIAGTEDGWIHRCSTSYSEQYLDSYEGHMGPVYALQWSPFRPNIWASASADWTIKLWQEGRQTALLNFQSGSHEVHDVQWCPTNSTVFGSVTSSGRLEIWDFGLSTVKPVVTHKAGSKLSCLLFAPTSPVVVCGSDNGKVSVFRLHNIEREYDTPEEQLSRLEDVIRANVMKTGMSV